MNQLKQPIVILVNSLMRGGAQRLVVHDLNELVARGVDVRLITLEAERPNDSLMADCRVPPDRRICIPFPSLYAPSSWLKLGRVLRLWKPHVLITHLWFSNTVGRLLAVCLRIPVRIAFEHNVYEGIRRPKQYVLDRWLAHHSTYIIAVSEAVHQFLLAHHLPAERIRVVRNAIELPDESAVDTASLRRQLSLPSDACVCLCVGRLIHQKGIDVLLRVFAKLPMGNLLLVGDGTERVALEALVDKLGLRPRVQFLGTRSDIVSLLRLADIFVLPSRWEGLPMVILEAMAAGTAIVASAVDGTKEVLVDGQTALLVPSESEEELGRALQLLMRHPERRAALGAAAKEASREYSIGRHVDRLLELVEQAEV